jgi:RNA polymerase sigma-70 factor (ECF subfamily)
MTGVKSRAEELTQEIFIKAWSSLRSFRGESAFSTWLHRLAVNHVLLSLRTDKRRDLRITTVDDVTRYERPGPTPTGDQGMDLESALARLPEGARIVIVLHDVQGYTHEEIGGMLGVTDGTSKAQLHRARRLLRVALEGRAS